MTWINDARRDCDHKAGTAQSTMVRAAVRIAWWAQDDRAEGIEAGNTAVDLIDEALRLLHDLRAAMVTENRRAQDETAARVDDLLARRSP